MRVCQAFVAQRSKFRDHVCVDCSAEFVSDGPILCVGPVFRLRAQFRPIERFLMQRNRTFYGMGITGDAAQLAFEFDCKLRAMELVDILPNLTLKGGLSGVANRVLGTNMTKGKQWE